MIEINLLPKEMQIQGPRLALNRQILVPAAAALVLAVGMAGLTFFQKQQIDQLDGKIRIARARAEQLQRDIQMVDGLVEIKTKITARIDAVQLLDQNRTAWVNVMEDLSGRMPEFLWLTAMRQVVALAPRGATNAPGDTSSANAVAAGSPQTEFPAEIEGYAYSLSGLANLMISLRKSGHFKDVDLKHAREVELESHPAYTFALSCTLDYTGRSGPEETIETDGPAELAQASESMGKRN
jgi:Tfp pilus assembly protein PilN